MTQIPKKISKPQPTAVREERITATGTWTKPDGVDWVELFLVGGGGAGTSLGGPPTAPNTFGSGAGGGGGSVRREVVPVSAPVPVTIGSGGVASPLSPSGTIDGTDGGDTVWGSGPTAITAQGGGAGFAPNPVGVVGPSSGTTGGHQPLTAIPSAPIAHAHAGGGSAEPATGPGFTITTRNRRADWGGSGVAVEARIYSVSGAGIEGFGGGGAGAVASSGGGTSPLRSVSGVGGNAAANTGGGGGGAHKINTDPAPLIRVGGNGGSGIAIVRYRA